MKGIKRVIFRANKDQVQTFKFLSEELKKDLVEHGVCGYEGENETRIDPTTLSFPRIEYKNELVVL